VASATDASNTASKGSSTAVGTDPVGTVLEGGIPYNTEVNVLKNVQKFVGVCTCEMLRS
jgi:hypothetical protein